jgi:hypothetical protein
MEIERDKSEDELYRLIGSEVSGLLGGPSDDDVLVKRGRKWFEMKLPKLRNAICVSPAVNSFVSSSDESLLATAVCDIIANLSLGVSPVTLTTLILRMGIQHLCESDNLSKDS